MTASTDFLTSRKNMRETKFVETQLSPLTAGQALMKVETFAFTANNVTYGAFGDAMMYWNFFPAPDGWGRVPVWGFGQVIESKAENVKPAQRFFGYFPMSTHLVVEPTRVGPHGFSDAAAHRQKMAPVYNNYTPAGADRGYSNREADQCLFRPLFSTSFFIDDFLVDNDFFGGRDVLLSSASSKTSLGLAFLLHKNRRGQVGVAGLTSKGNAAFVEKTGYYDRVVTYDAIAQSPRDKAAVFVDMAGSGEVRAAVHQRWNDNLKYSCAVGATHWEQMKPTTDLPGPRPALFFAPDLVKKRTQDWGAEGLKKRLADAVVSFLPTTDKWMKIVHGKGRADIERVYAEMVGGKAKPEEGHMLAL
jgi:hypothetical protein